MRVSIGRFSAIFLMVLIYPLVIVTHLIRFIAGYHKPDYESTIEGDPLKYSGDLPLLIAVWSEDASVWTVATADVVQQLKQEFVGRCEFVYVEASSKSVTEIYDAEIVPVLILRHRGKEIERFVNTMELDEVRPAISAIAD